MPALFAFSNIIERMFHRRSLLSDHPLKFRTKNRSRRDIAKNTHLKTRLETETTIFIHFYNFAYRQREYFALQQTSEIEFCASHCLDRGNRKGRQLVSLKFVSLLGLNCFWINTNNKDCVPSKFYINSHCWNCYCIAKPSFSSSLTSFRSGGSREIMAECCCYFNFLHSKRQFKMRKIQQQRWNNGKVRPS